MSLASAQNSFVNSSSSSSVNATGGSTLAIVVADTINDPVSVASAYSVMFGTFQPKYGLTFNVIMKYSGIFTPEAGSYDLTIYMGVADATLITPYVLTFPNNASNDKTLFSCMGSFQITTSDINTSIPYSVEILLDGASPPSTMTFESQSLIILTEDVVN